MLQQYLPFTVLKHYKGSCSGLKTTFKKLQQYLPFTVLKLYKSYSSVEAMKAVATVLTVYGIETDNITSYIRMPLPNVATVLTVYGIETTSTMPRFVTLFDIVATVLTVYGIETTEE